MKHDEIQELLGAYALDAVSPDEAAAVERHLVDCPRCRSEVEAHRETAASLAHVGMDAPEGVWERIADRLGSASPVPPARRVRPRWPALAAVAAAVLLFLGLGAVVVRQDDRIDRLAAVHTVEMQSADGALRVGVLVLGNGRGYVLGGNLPPAAEGRTYQLWTIADGRPTSAGLLGAEARSLGFRVPEDTHLLAVTEERAGGAEAPSSAPLVAGRVAT